jgi:tRNA pseudouridine38-40 synthase
MARYKLTIEYDGGPYRGFQAQETLPSVQGALERAILGFTGTFSRVHVAGRTDTGVHATHQVCHFDTDKDVRDAVVRDALNAHLVPDPIVVLAAERVDDDFHARFQAVGRRYLYRVLDRRPPPALERARLWWVKTPLDVEAMAQAAQLLIGTHDFTTFRDAHCQAKSPLRTLDQVTVARVGDEVHLRYAARSFLHRQVRSLTGSLVEVGSGRWTAADLKAALEARDRARCGQVAPAHGLYLTGVEYGPICPPPAEGA